MSTKDNTGDKLVASIRRTKAGTAGTTAADTSAAKKPARKPPASKASAKPKPATKSKPAVNSDAYQAARRVWPD